MEKIRLKLAKIARLFEELVLRRHWADSDTPGCFSYLRVEHFAKDMLKIFFYQVCYLFVKDKVKDIEIFENYGPDFAELILEIQILSHMF